MNEWRLLVWLKNTDTGQNAIFRRRVRFVSFPDGTDMEGGGNRYNSEIRHISLAGPVPYKSGKLGRKISHGFHLSDVVF